AADLPDYTAAAGVPSVDCFYTWSLSSHRAFTP
ncbi:MAG: hypothetical protein JWL81_3204, partial [Verrucomicrobiales bacterium]|nr:hypothetical protein [Verrucomicrobiales bacterium]